MIGQSEFLSRLGSREKILEEIAVLARAYTPEWSFTSRNPDGGSVIAMIYAKQLEENLERFGRLLDGLQTEFVNLIGLTLASAAPAAGVVTFSLAQDTVSGTYVREGSKLLGEGEIQPIVFETAGGIFVSNARISEVIQASAGKGRIVPVYGGACMRTLAKGELSEQFQAKTEQGDMLRHPIPAFELFDFSEQGIAQNAVIMWHPYLFDTPVGASFRVRFEGAQTIVEQLADREAFEWLYYGESGFSPFEAVKLVQEGMIELTRNGSLGEVMREGVPNHCIVVRARGVVRETLAVESICFSSECGGVAADFVLHNEEQLAVEEFLPFGETAGLYDECYIGCEQIFARRGATVALTFDLSYRERAASLAVEREDENLRLIKRKPVKLAYHAAQTAVHQAAFEYFNGKGWCRLPFDRDMSSIFSGEISGQVEACFVCPEDFSAVPVGGFEGRCIRIRITRADHCYLQPCIHSMPVIKNLLISYDYGCRWSAPASIVRQSGTQERSITRDLIQAGEVALFAPLPFSGNHLLIGFDRPITGAPASVYFDLTSKGEPLDIQFFYYGINGFVPFRVSDQTDGLSHSGVVQFIPPSDWKQTELCTRHCWWLSIVQLTDCSHGGSGVRIHQILFNTAQVHNIETHPEQSFYISSAEANTEFRLGSEQLLTAEVFVNEMPRFSTEQMHRFAQSHPQEIRLNTDRMGNITEFYVRWQEVDSFDDSKADDRHYLLDRLSGVLRFGDGIQGAIPPAQNDAAVLVRTLCCNGREGNLSAGMIRDSQSNLPFIGMLHNPAPTTAGCDMETVESAHRRGAAMISSRRRIVSQLDFEREAFACSDAICRVCCLCGVDALGRRAPRAVTIVVLTKDYGRADLFVTLRRQIKKALLPRCELTVAEDELHIVAPHFIEISVQAWITVNAMEQAFELQREITARLTAYLNPVWGGDGEGWRIGVLPTPLQIGTTIRSISGDFFVDRIASVVRLHHEGTMREIRLEEWGGDPFAVGISGVHTVLISAK